MDFSAILSPTVQRVHPFLPIYTSHKNEREQEKDKTMLRMALTLMGLSHDAETQHGCVITDKHYRIVAAGYNGFPRGMQDDKLPNTRPGKYLWMVHSEDNSVSNALIPLWTIQNTTAFITGLPCQNCALRLVQNGVLSWVLLNRKGTQLEDEKTLENLNILIRDGGVEVIAYSKSEVLNDEYFDRLKNLRE